MSPPIAGARRIRRVGRAALACLVIGVVLLGLGLAARPPAPFPGLVGSAHGAGGGGGGGGGNLPPLNLTINLTDRPSFDPGTLSVPVDTALHLTVHNVGAYNHTFTLVNRPGFLLNRSWDPSTVAAFFRANGTQANVSLAGGANGSVDLSFTSVQAGFSFEFVSLVPYQFEAGMFGFLNVTGPASGPGVEANVSASATVLAFVPDTVAINASTYPVTVDLAISNQGSNFHTFWLEAQANVTLNSGNFSTYFQAHPPLASVNIPTTPGQVVWANVSFPKAGIYEFICNVPGHFAAGMNGFIYVGVAPPAPPAPESTALVQVWVLWGGAGILGFGSLLAASALVIGRFPQRPPPEHH